jgi:hypothetical protein
MNDPCAAANVSTADPDEGKQTTYRTSADYIPASPMGLLPACWKVEHRCTRCHERIGSDQLIAHARQHEKEVIADT